MDNSSLSCTSISEGNHNSIDKLSTGLSIKLKINDENQPSNTNDVHKIPLEGYYIEEGEEYSDEQEKEDEDEDFSEEELLAQMGYVKSTPQIEESNKSQTRRLLEESILAQLFNIKKEPPKHEPITTPTAELNLVSAFKGSREKEGTPVKERRVLWAPDVYDPPPISMDVAGKNRQKGGGKKAGASEGKGGRGSKGGVEKGKTTGKDKVKKQGKKRGGGGGGGGGASKYSEFW